MELDLVKTGTRVEADGGGEPFDISASRTRTFLLVMHITEQIEQESLDVLIFGSADGQAWDAKPILKLPQQFYCGETRAVLDLTLRPQTRFIRVRWVLNRWGRVAPTPMFVFDLHATEVSAMPSAVTPAQLAATGKS